MCQADELQQPVFILGQRAQSRANCSHDSKTAIGPQNLAWQAATLIPSSRAGRDGAERKVAKAQPAMRPKCHRRTQDKAGWGTRVGVLNPKP